MLKVLLAAYRAGPRRSALFSSKFKPSAMALERRGLVSWRYVKVPGWTLAVRLTANGRAELKETRA